MKQESKSRELDQYIIRFPEGMRDEIKKAAEANYRTMNAEILFRLAQTFRTAAAEEPLQPPAPFAGRHPTTASGPHSDIGSQTSAADPGVGQGAFAASPSAVCSTKPQYRGP